MASTGAYPEIYDTDEGLKKLGTYLRSVNGVKVRAGVEHDKRVEYFKGKNNLLHIFNIVLC
jgi:hypothetical protein